MLFSLLLHITNLLCHLLQGVLEIRVLKLQLCSRRFGQPSEPVCLSKRPRKIKRTLLLLGVDLRLARHSVLFNYLRREAVNCDAGLDIGDDGGQRTRRRCQGWPIPLERVDNDIKVIQSKFE